MNIHVTDFLERLDLSTRTINVLRREGIDSMSKLMELTREQVKKMAGAGERAALEVHLLQQRYNRPADEQEIERLIQATQDYNRALRRAFHTLGKDTVQVTLTPEKQITIAKVLVA